MDAIPGGLGRFGTALGVVRPWQIAAAVIAVVVLTGGSRTAEAQASARVQVAATVIPAAAAWETRDGVLALLRTQPTGGMLHTSVATIVSEPATVPAGQGEADPRRILTVNYLAN